MSEKVARLAVRALRDDMFPTLPESIRRLFPETSDPMENQPVGKKVPNIVLGEYVDFGANAALPMITVNADGAADLTTRAFRHLSLHVDIWVSASQAPNADARRIVSIIYEKTFKALHGTNYSGEGVLIKKSYEIERSKIMFEPDQKIYHLANTYRVEAVSALWY